MLTWSDPRIAPEYDRARIRPPASHLIGRPMAPPPEEAGWKDTVVHMVGTVTRIVTRWAPRTAPLHGPGSPAPGVNLFPFDPTGGNMFGIVTTCSMRTTI
jgi:hypothetical protein